MKTIDLNSAERREILPGLEARFVHSENMTIAYWNIKKGCELPAHSHFHEQITHVIEGEFELEIEGEKRILTPGQVAIIPSTAMHSGIALTECIVIDTFYPKREDYV